MTRNATNESATRTEVRRLFYRLGELLEKLDDKSALELVNYAVTSALYLLKITKPAK